MKNLIVYTLLTIIISSFGINTVLAEDIPANLEGQDGEEVILLNKLQDPDYVQSAIPKPTTLPGPEGENADRASLTSSILPRIAVGIIGFAGAAALVFLIIGGVRYATAYGEDEAVEKAKKQVMYAIIGFFLAILSYTIVTIITNLNFGA